MLTVFLAMGAWRISRDKVLTRRMPAIEALGSATVLCVDKTGHAHREPHGARGGAGERCRGARSRPRRSPANPSRSTRWSAPSWPRRRPQAQAIRREWTLERDYPFGADFLAVCHVWRSPQGARRVAIKGAAETVMPLCAMDRAATRGSAARRSWRRPSAACACSPWPRSNGRDARAAGRSSRVRVSLAGFRRARRSRCARKCPARSRFAAARASAS